MIYLVNFADKEQALVQEHLNLRDFKVLTEKQFYEVELLDNSICLVNDIEVDLSKITNNKRVQFIGYNCKSSEMINFSSLSKQSLENTQHILDKFSLSMSRENYLFNRIKQSNQKIKQLILTLESDVENNKKRYKKVRNFLKKDFKNVSFQTLFKVGLNSGSEIQEIFESQTHVYWVFIHTDNYEASSEFYSILAELSNKVEISLNFLVATLLEKSKYLPNKKENLQLFIGCLSKKDLKLDAYLFGNFYVLSTVKEHIYFRKNIPFDLDFLERGKISFQFSRDEKVLILSPGALQNLDDFKSDDELIAFILKHLSTGKDDLLDEIMLDLADIQKGRFFDFDASLGYLEVSKNAIIDIS